MTLTNDNYFSVEASMEYFGVSQIKAYPRSLALAEAGWSFQKNRSWEGFLTRLKPTVKDMMRRGITFSMEY